MLSFFWFSFLVAFFILFFYRWHYLVVLLCLELMMLRVFVVSFFVFSFNSAILGFFLLLFVVLMGSFGLSVLVYCFRSWGEDFYKVNCRF